MKITEIEHIPRDGVAESILVKFSDGTTITMLYNKRTRNVPVVYHATGNSCDTGYYNIEEPPYREYYINDISIIRS